MSKKALSLLIILSVSFCSIYADITDNFTFSFKKDGLSSFYFEPREVIAFKNSEDPNTVATADFSVGWRIFIDTGFKISLEACAYNIDSEEDNYCLMHSNGIIGLNYLMKAGDKTAGDDNNQNKLSKEARTLIVIENNGSSVLPVEGTMPVTLSIPYPTYEGDVAVNGVYTGYLILTLTYN